MKFLRATSIRLVCALMLLISALAIVSPQQASATTASDCLSSSAFCIDAYRHSLPPPDYYWGTIYVDGYDAYPFKPVDLYYRIGATWYREKSVTADGSGRFHTTMVAYPSCARIYLNAVTLPGNTGSQLPRWSNEDFVYSLC
jgi:hypothetical protein